MRRILTVTALIALISLSACSKDHPEPAAVSSQPPATSAAPSPSVDVMAEQSCKLLAEATGSEEPDGGLLVAGTVEKIAETADASGNTGLRVAGQQLTEKRDAALDAIIANDGSETTAKVKLATAAIQMKTVCVEAGFPEES